MNERRNEQTAAERGNKRGLPGGESAARPQMSDIVTTGHKLRDTAPLIDRFMLTDGRTVSVRPVQPQNSDAEKVFMKALSPASRRARFHGEITSLSEEVLRDLTQLDYRTQVAIVAEACDAAIEPVIVADARYSLQDRGDVANFAVVVADAWQGVGLGIQIMRRLGEYARQQGVRCLTGEVLQYNALMVALVRSLGGRLAKHPQDASLLCALFVL